MNDQQIKKDAGKPRLSLVPWQIAFDIAEVRDFGVKKYGETDSWKRVELQRYIDALLRHTLAFVEDIHSVDDESGIPHYKHMECNMAFISQMMAEEGRAAAVTKAKCDHSWISEGEGVWRCVNCGEIAD